MFDRRGETVTTLEDAPGVDALCAAMTRAGHRFTAMIRNAPVETPIRGSEWSVADTAAHLVGGLAIYHEYLGGSSVARMDVTNIAGGTLAISNAKVLADETERDPIVLADRFEEGLRAVVHGAEGRAADEVMSWHGLPIPLSTFLALGLAEVLIHGLDVARALDVPWPIEAEDARSILFCAGSVLPTLLDPETASAVKAIYEVRLRGGRGRMTMTFDRGTLVVVAQPAAKADCRINADPVAFLLVFYGRMSQWQAIGRGQLIAWGRRPWLGLRLKRLLATP